jgi:MFS transporter, DHA2 family, multidrug resistance protein
MAGRGGAHADQVAVNVERTSELLCGEADRREGLEDDVLVHAHILPVVGIEEEPLVVEVVDPVVVEVDAAPAEIQVVGVVELAVVDGGAGVDVTGKEQAGHGLLAEVGLDRHAILVSEGRRYGWGSQMIVMLFRMSGVSLAAFVIAELKTKEPFVEIRLYKNLPFAMGCLIGFLNTMEFRGTNFLLPIMLQRIYHYTPFQAGLFFLPPALVMGITSILAGRLSDTIQPKLLLMIGLVGLTYVSFEFCGLDVWATTGLLLGLVVLRRGAQAFCHSPLSTSTLRGVPEDQVRMASGLFNMHRTLAGAVGVALTATLMDYREDVHTLILSQRQALYPLGTEVATDAIRGMLIQDGESGGMLAQKTAGILRQKLSEEAALTGYHDLFFMFAALTLFSLLPVMLMRGSKPVLPVKVVQKE